MLILASCSDVWKKSEEEKPADLHNQKVLLTLKNQWWDKVPTISEYLKWCQWSVTKINISGFVGNKFNFSK